MKFSDILSGVNGKLKVLPILHTCDAYGFRSILDSKELQPQRCDVFDKDYLYAYYGVPSYRIKTNAATNNLSLFPVCCILDYEKVDNLIKIYPFDTGAFMKMDEIKKQHFHPKMKLENFELIPNIKNAVRVVEKFYKTNLNYIKKRVQIKSENLDPVNFEAHSYFSLITDGALSKTDDRVSTIELIFNNAITLSKDTLINIILPSSFMDDKKISKTIRDDFNISSPFVYHTVKGDPQEYFGLIYNTYLSFVERNNYI